MRDAVVVPRQSHRWVVLGLAAAACLLVGLLGVLHASQANAAADLSTGLTYTDNGADITVTGCIGGVNNCPAELIIPDAIAGKPVTSISEFAFAEGASLTTLTIGNSVTTIGKYAFYRNSHLTPLTIGNSITTINEFTFAEETSLTTLTIGNSITTIGNYAFSHATQLTTLSIPNSITTIGNFAFGEAAQLTTLTIGNLTFYGATSLTTITCLGDAPSMGPNPFGNTASGPVFYRSDADGWSGVSNPLDGHPLVAVDTPTSLTSLTP